MQASTQPRAACSTLAACRVRETSGNAVDARRSHKEHVFRKTPPQTNQCGDFFAPLVQFTGSHLPLCKQGSAHVQRTSARRRWAATHGVGQQRTWHVCRFVCPGVRIRSVFEEGLLRVANPNGRRTVSRGESGPVVPLFTSAASAVSSHAGGGNAPRKLFPKTVEFGGGGLVWFGSWLAPEAGSHGQCVLPSPARLAVWSHSPPDC